MPALVGLGAAAAAAREEGAARTAHLAALRDRFEARLAAHPGRDRPLRGPRRACPTPRTSAFAGVEGEALLIRLDLAGLRGLDRLGLLLGRGRAEQTLLAMGLPRDEALSSLRVCFGITNRTAEVDAFLAVLAREVAELRRR